MDASRDQLNRRLTEISEKLQAILQKLDAISRSLDALAQGSGEPQTVEKLTPELKKGGLEATDEWEEPSAENDLEQG